MIARGIRNNNPGNIEAGINWQGLAQPHEMTPEQKAEDRFAVFRSPEWGVRAIVKILQTYERKYGIKTIRGIISRWAPSTENQTGKYIDAVVSYVAVGPDAALNLRDGNLLTNLVKAIIRHENGSQPYSDATIRAGIALAGLDEAAAPKPKPVSKSKRVKGAVATAGATGAVTAIGMAMNVLKEAQAFVDQILGLDPQLMPGLAIVFGVALLGFLIYVGWTVWVDYRDDREPEEVV